MTATSTGLSLPSPVLVFLNVAFGPGDAQADVLYTCSTLWWLYMRTAVVHSGPISRAMSYYVRQKVSACTG
ncbi:hypothetical protein EDC04DRAFT_2696852 [Pisolithus marmoratus]|nr:hypothetical protein EDC04DRAFT_2696852 [Pisolithus marmoratus]